MRICRTVVQYPELKIKLPPAKNLIRALNSEKKIIDHNFLITL